MAGDLWTRFAAVAAAQPAHPALLLGETAISFAALEAAAVRAAGRLRRAGVVPGDRVVVWADNAPETAVALLGLWAEVAIPVLVNADAPPHHLRHAAAVTGAALVLAPEDAPVPADCAASRFDIARIGAFGEASGDAGSGRPAVPHGGEPASILFTSGSTGLPKGVVQSHDNLAAGCDAVAAVLGYRASDRILCAIPWAFDYGWGQFLSSMLRGLSHVMPEARHPVAICAAIARHRPTVLPGVPSLFAALLRGVSPLRETDLASVRLVSNTGSKIPADLFGELRAVFAGADVSLNYGLTETYRSASLPVAEAVLRPDSVGRAIPGVALAVLRPDGTPAAPGEEGEIVHRGAGVFLGYWGMPEKTAEVRRPDPLWRHAGIAAPPAVFTGDLGWFDADGFLYIRGRRDRQIKSMGVRVSPDDVEVQVAATGLVAEAAVLALPHDMLGEMVVCAVVPRAAGADPLPALKRAARAAMSPYMQPREWRVLPALPRTPSGKVDYPALKGLFLEAAE